MYQTVTFWSARARPDITESSDVRLAYKDELKRCYQSSLVSSLFLS